MTDSPHAHPERIGPYRLLQVIGEGGMGVVYEAEQLEPVRRRVAVKMMRGDLDTKDVIARFEAERQALALMEHPGIAKVLDAGATDQGRPYFVMELVRGIPLDEYANQERLSTRERISLFIEACAAVQHAHQKGIIHRDLKPSNILVTEFDGAPRPKIIDFGIAKATGQRLTEHTAVTIYGQALGTLAYMSPEQAEVSGLDVDTRTDIYSLGIVLFELLAGVPPIHPTEIGPLAFLGILTERDVPMPTLAQALERLEPARLERVVAARRTTEAALRRELLGDLRWITLKATEKDRRRRYDTADALRADLERYLADEPVVARPPSTAYRLRKFVRRHRAGVAFSASAVAGLIAFGGAMAVQAERLARERDRAVRETLKANAVTEFMNGVLLAADPLDGIGPDATILNALDWIVAEHETSFSDDPEVDAGVRHAIGTVYKQLGRLDEAERLLAPALDTRLAVLEADHPDIGATLHQLGDLRVARGDLDSAAVLLERALDVRRSSLDPTSEPLAQTLNRLGAVRVNQGNAEAAEPLLTEALRIFRAQDEETVAVSEALDVLGQLHRLKNEPETAERYIREALEVRERFYADDHPKIGESLNNLAVVLDDAGRREEAVAMYRRAIAVYEVTYGARSDAVAVALSNLGLALTDLGENAEGERAHRLALEITQEVAGPASFNAAIQHNNLARHLCTFDDPAEGSEHARTAVRIGDEAFEEGAFVTGVFRSTQGFCLGAVGEHARAEEVLLRSISILEASVGPEHRHTRTARDRLAALRASLERGG